MNRLSSWRAPAWLLADVSAIADASTPSTGDRSTSAALISATRASSSASMSSATSPISSMTSGDGDRLLIRKVCHRIYTPTSSGLSTMPSTGV
ncbi:Uncharacterised protein [Mycobacteroides abscessus subsp. abscessus]|nr:Uncharacterised protein [Mycobacteroides abscessus subsp. abscessus]